MKKRHGYGGLWREHSEKRPVVMIDEEESDTPLPEHIRLQSTTPGRSVGVKNMAWVFQTYSGKRRCQFPPVWAPK